MSVTTTPYKIQTLNNPICILQTKNFRKVQHKVTHSQCLLGIVIIYLIEFLNYFVTTQKRYAEEGNAVCF